MMNVIILIVITTIWTLGLMILTNEGMLLYKLRMWAEFKQETTGNSVWQPLILCVWCLPSIHTSIGYAFAMCAGLVAFDWKLILLYPIVAMATSFTGGILWTLYMLVDTKIENFKLQNELYNGQINESDERYREIQEELSEALRN